MEALQSDIIQNYPGGGHNPDQRTFILRWNPAISSITIHNHIDSIAHIDDWEFNWSVYEWEKAHEGDRFYMMRVGDGNTGIVMSGIFISEPYTERDWNRVRKTKEIHYMDMQPNYIVNPETMPIITTAQLQEAIPDFEWSKGHSGALLTDDQAERLEYLFEEYLAAVKDMADGENLALVGVGENRYANYFDAQGGHIETIMPPEQFVDEQLPEIGTWSFYAESVCKFSNNEIKDEEVEIVALRVGDEMGMTALLLKNEAEDSYDFLTVYPMHKGECHLLRITKIQELKSQIEAVVHAKTEELSLAFFATDYFLNKDKYVVGNDLDIELAACAYSLYEGEETTVLDEETSERMRKDMGLEEEYDEEGKLKPLTLYNGELVAFLNDDDEFPDDVSFASKVKSVKNVSLFGNKYVKAVISICHEPDETYIPLYFKKEMLDGVRKGTLLRGAFWLQGKIVEEK